MFRVRGNNGVGISSVTTTAATLNAWHHYVCVRDALGSLLMYTDGALSVSGIDNTTGSLTYTFELGNDQGQVNGIQGSMDDVRVYDRAVGPSEVRRLYKHSKEGHPTSLGLRLPVYARRPDINKLRRTTTGKNVTRATTTSRGGQ